MRFRTSYKNRRDVSRKHRLAEARGRYAEWLAIFVLKLKLYRIRAHRWKCRLGEIDIIASKGRKIVFVEVKQRHCLREARFAVNMAATRRLIRAAEFYLQRHAGKLPADFEVRFDIIAIGRVSVHHAIDAFSPA